MINLWNKKQTIVNKLLHIGLMLPALVLWSFASDANTFQTKDYTIKVDVLSNKLDTPWGMVFLPDNSILITEKDGQLRLFDNGKLSEPISGVPSVAARGQGGLLDVTIDPDFSENNLVYLSYSEPGKGGAGLAVARGVLQNNQLQNVTVIYRQNKKSRGSRHFGSRLVFADDGTLFVTHGDRGDRPRAQDSFDHAGSVIRINADGSIPADNPFADGKTALAEIWSIGHRNIQGAALHPQTRKLWTIEHGARGGDEVNQPEAGKNYGWPVISYGVHYLGTKIGEGTAKPGLEQPKYYWDPSIAPSGLTFYQGDLFKRWQGDLLVGSLKFGQLSHLRINNGKVEEIERIFDRDYGRVRDVTIGPDGAIYLLTVDSSGMLLKLTPVQ